jgi:hypothetical protein
MRFFVISCQLNSAAALLAEALTPPSSGQLSPSRQLPRIRSLEAVLQNIEKLARSGYAI